VRERCSAWSGALRGEDTLDRSYPRLAEERGAVVHAEREATCLRRVDGGWEIETVYPGAWLRKRRELFRAEQVVLAAGVLGWPNRGDEDARPPLGSRYERIDAVAPRTPATQPLAGAAGR
jgi:hypothetical protein